MWDEQPLCNLRGSVYGHVTYPSGLFFGPCTVGDIRAGLFLVESVPRLYTIPEHERRSSAWTRWETIPQYELYLLSFQTPKSSHHCFRFLIPRFEDLSKRQTWSFKPSQAARDNSLPTRPDGDLLTHDSPASYHAEAMTFSIESPTPTTCTLRSFGVPIAVPTTILMLHLRQQESRIFSSNHATKK